MNKKETSVNRSVTKSTIKNTYVRRIVDLHFVLSKQGRKDDIQLHDGDFLAGTPSLTLREWDQSFLHFRRSVGPSLGLEFGGLWENLRVEVAVHCGSGDDGLNAILTGTLLMWPDKRDNGP